VSDLEASAREAAAEARVLYRERLFRGACSRAYYAMFNTARAMLASRGYRLDSIKKHKSVLRLFSLEFVKNGPLEPQVGQALQRAAEARHVADYEGGINEAEAGEVMEALEMFLRLAEQAISPSRKSQSIGEDGG